MYKILNTKAEANKLQDDILDWYKGFVDVNATKWSDENKHQSQNKWAVPVPAGFGYPVAKTCTYEAGENIPEELVGKTYTVEVLEYNEELVNDLPAGWYEEEII